jgi:hypothetical protein
MGWHTIEDGEVDQIQSGANPAGEGDFIKHPENWGGKKGDKAEWFDKDWMRIPDSELVKKGLRKDNRGRWYNKETRASEIVHDMDKDAPENCTREVPLVGESFQFFNEQKNKWDIDVKRKELSEKQAEYGTVLGKIIEYERKGDRASQEINIEMDVDENKNRLKKIRAEIEKIRPEENRLDAEIKVLEADLKSA